MNSSQLVIDANQLTINYASSSQQHTLSLGQHAAILSLQQNQVTLTTQGQFPLPNVQSEQLLLSCEASNHSPTGTLGSPSGIFSLTCTPVTNGPGGQSSIIGTTDVKISLTASNSNGSSHNTSSGAAATASQPISWIVDVQTSSLLFVSPQAGKVEIRQVFHGN